MFIITLQPQYNALGERKFWGKKKKSQTKPNQPNKPALHYPSDKALGNLTSLSANHWTSCLLLKLKNVMVCLSMEGREPGKALILQVLLSNWHERELVVVLLQKEAALGSCPRAHAAGTQLAWGHTKQMCTGRESPAKHKWHKVGFVIAALSVTTRASLQWNTDLSWALGGTHLGTGAKHCTVLQGMAVKMHPWTSGTPTLSLKKGISGHRINCFGDVNLGKFQCGCVISDAKYTFVS